MENSWKEWFLLFPANSVMDWRHVYIFFSETNTGAATLAKYRTFKSIRRNLFTEAIRPQRDLKPFITPLMTRQCQHAEFTRWQGHLHLLVLSITFQCVTHIFAPFLPQGHFSLFSSNGFAHLTSFFFFITLQGQLWPNFVTVWDGRSDTTLSTFSRWDRKASRDTYEQKSKLFVPLQPTV